jgi:preprotein translocase YajC subunit
MGRFAFVLLIVPTLLCFATEELLAQNQEATNETAVAPTMVGVEPDTKPSDSTKENLVEMKTSVEQGSKSKPSLLEEFLSSPLNYFLVLVVCLYVYLMFVQPRGARQAKKLQAERLNHLKKNDRVVTSAGIHGIVSSINSEAGTVTLRVDENSNAKLTIDRDSIRSVAS